VSDKPWWAGIVNTQATEPPPEPVDIHAAMREWIALIPPPEQIMARIEAGPVAQAAIIATTTPAPPKRPGEMPHLGVPIHRPNPDDPFGHPGGCCWRAINAAGGVMREGCVLDLGDAKVLLYDSP
jgi:hypothetical protein